MAELGSTFRQVSVLLQCWVHHSQQFYSEYMLYTPPPHVSIIIKLWRNHNILFPHWSPLLLLKALLSFLMNLLQRRRGFLRPYLEVSFHFLAKPVLQKEWITFKCLNTPVSEDPSHILLPQIIFPKSSLPKWCEDCAFSANAFMSYAFPNLSDLFIHSFTHSSIQQNSWE